MPNWVDSRLVVQVNGEIVSPIESFTPTFSLNTEVIHSIEATHVGYVANPPRFTFSLSARAIGGASARLTELAMKGREFQIALLKASGSTNEWDFDRVLLNRCLVTSANPSNATINGAPMATFSGVSLEATVDSNQLPEFSSPGE